MEHQIDTNKPHIIHSQHLATAATDCPTHPQRHSHGELILPAIPVEVWVFPAWNGSGLRNDWVHSRFAGRICQPLGSRHSTVLEEVFAVYEIVEFAPLVAKLPWTLHSKISKMIQYITYIYIYTLHSLPVQIYPNHKYVYIYIYVS